MASLPRESRPYPSAVTRQMVMNFLQGGAAANVFANTLDVQFRVVDAGVAGDPIEHPDLVQARIAPGTQNFLERPAMSAAQVSQAMEAGRELGSEPGCDAVCFGEMGIGNTSSATLVAHKLLQLPLDGLTGRGTGLDDAGLQRKRDTLERAAARTQPSLDASTALTEYGGLEIAMMAGAIEGAAKAGRIVIVDGFIATVAVAIGANCQSGLATTHDLCPSIGRARTPGCATCTWRNSIARLRTAPWRGDRRVARLADRQISGCNAE